MEEQHIFFIKNIDFPYSGTTKHVPLRKNPLHHTLENSLIKNYNIIFQNKQDFWKLKSRVQWINDGMLTLSFFTFLLANEAEKIRY